MIKYLYIHIIEILLIWALMSMAGCSDRGKIPLPEEGMYNSVCLYIDLKLDDNYIAGRANRPEDEDWQPGTINENNITSLQLFWKDNGNWMYRDISDLDFQKIDDEMYARVELEKDIPQLADLEMWIGANLSGEQINSFVNNNKYTLNSENEDWRGELAPFTSASNERNGIAMFCIESSVPDVTESNLEKEYHLSFTLKRLVAKVHVTCRVDNEENPVYAKLVPNTDENFDGWIKVSDVRYALNGVNRSTYIMHNVKENSDYYNYDNNVEDTNPDLYTYTEQYNDVDENPYLQKIGNDFYYYTISDLLVKDALYRGVAVYSQNKKYTDGIYCPENTFFFSSGKDDESKLSGHNSAWGMITSISIKAKFTPKYLNVEGGLFDYIIGEETDDEIKTAVQNIKGDLLEEQIDKDKVYSVVCPSEKVAKAFLVYSLKQNGFLSDKIKPEDGFADETYFYNSFYKKYYTYGAAKKNYGITVNSTKLGNYKPYYDGWGFYYTYIDNRHRNNKEDSFVFYKHGQVERNRYYVITINSFSSPGASSDKGKYVEVNTNILPWKEGGSGSVTLD